MGRTLCLLAFLAHFAFVLATALEDLLRVTGQGGTVLPAAVASGAAKVAESLARGLQLGPLRSYGHYLGSEAGSSYFAPNVPEAFRLDFALTNSTGYLERPSLTSGSREGDLRLGALLDTLGSAEVEEFRELLVQRAAAWMLGQHLGTTAVRVTLVRLSLPTAAEYADGARPRREEVRLYDLTTAEEHGE